MLDAANRSIAAQLSALQFLTEVVLANMMLQQSDGGAQFMADLLRVGSKFDHLRAKDDADAEELADIAVQTQQRIEAIVRKARGRAEGEL